MTERSRTAVGHLSRRQLLSLTGKAAAVATLGPAIAGRPTIARASTPEAIATPDVGVPGWPELPLHSTLQVDASPLFREVADAVMAAMERFHVPGVAIGLLAGDREEHATFGVESLSSLRAVSPETRFQIGSITKTVTSTAIWQLVDAGVLDIDAPLRTYLLDLTLQDEDVVQQVTVRHLLDHTAGWYGDEGVDTGDDDRAIARYVSERLPELPQSFPLGAYFSYNNAAFTVLGHLIEVATGLPYNAAIQHMVLGPVGMDESSIGPADLQHPYADGHAAFPINGRPAVTVMTPLSLPRSVDPAGGMWSTTRDMLRYAHLHSAPGVIEGRANVISTESRERMQEPSVSVPGYPLQMGMDWFSQDIDDVRVIFHSGDTFGQHAELVMIPGHQMTLVVLTNGQGGGSPVAAAALDTVLANTPGLSALAGKVGLTSLFSATPEVPRVELSRDEQAEYVGEFADPGMSITFEQTGDGLQMTATPIEEPGALLPAFSPPPARTVPIQFLDTDTAVVGGTRIPFVRDEVGRIGWVSSGLRLIPRVDEIP